MDANLIAKQFIQYYYSIFEKDRAQLEALYRPTSMLTFEGHAFQGAHSIIEKLLSLPFGKVQHAITTTDVQLNGSSLLVVVTGELLIDNETNPQRFTQVFQLAPENSTYWVLNDIFRLNYG
ncbi:hypothetical protein G9A89_007376 [Geosiphon pyriformis]|nr:hypothetical protein G9A89_007376 [Geosiphon pyriformis]